MAKTLSQKSSYRLFLWGLLLIPLATVADSVLDAVLFGMGSLQELLLTPSYHELAARTLFSTFILAAIYLGMHFLANTSQKEQSLQQRNRDLGLARQDLEEFNDDLALHLRNAVSELTTSVELFKVQCDQQLDDKALFFLEGIAKASHKLNEQINIGQALAEISFGEPRRERVKLDKLAQEVVEELKFNQPEMDIEFKIQPWLTMICDRKMLRLVIYNIFCSAIGSIPQDRKGKIEFGMFYRNAQKVFFVRDNGRGFSDAEARLLFEPFLDNDQNSAQAKGSIRLASARRLIHRHGGQVWAEGSQGVSGTIFFTCSTTSD